MQNLSEASRKEAVSQELQELFERFKNTDMMMNPSEYNRIIVKIKMFAKDKYEFANHIVDLFCKQQSLVFVSIWIIRLIWVFCVEGRKK